MKGGGKIKKDYIYANMRVKCFEMNLFGPQDFEIMFSLSSISDLVAYLKNRAWSIDENDGSITSLIDKEEKNLWNFVKEVVGDLSDFYFILVKKDFLNLKAIIRGVLSEFDVTDLLDFSSILDPNVLQSSIRNQNFGNLPWYIKDVAKSAFETLLKTNDALISDAIIDNGMFLVLKKISNESNSLLVKNYVELLLTYACINVSLRSVSLKRNTRNYLEKALIETGTFDFTSLLNATLKGKDSLVSYLNSATYLTPYPFVYNENKNNLNIWFDRCVFSIIEKGRSGCFGLDPIFSYVLSKYSEFKKLNLVFSNFGRSKERLNEYKERLRVL